MKVYRKEKKEIELNIIESENIYSIMKITFLLHCGVKLMYTHMLSN